MDEPKDFNNRWRFTKDIPISVVLFLIGQTLGGAMFLAVQNKTLVDVVAVVKDFPAIYYTKESATAENRLQESRQQNATERYNELLRRISILEGQIQQKR